MKKVLVFLADGFEEIEAITPIDILRRAEIDVTTVSITDSLSITAAHGVVVQSDTTINNVSFDNVDLLLLPGGMPGATNLNECSLLKEKLLEFHAQKKYIAAICAAPLVLGGLGILKGKSCTCYPGYEDTLTEATKKDSAVVIDGNIITGNGPGAAVEFSFAIVSILVNKSVADDWAKKMMFV